MYSVRKIIYALLLTGLYRCASPVTPTGGPKDILPPILLSSEPQNRTTGQKPSIITFNFNENIQLKNETEKISVSPAIPYKIRKKNKSFSLELESEKLQPNTTYSIYFSDCIGDLNEGNLYSMDPFIFSTGESIDSLRLSGTINNLISSKTRKYRVHILSVNDTLIRFPQITDTKFTGTGLQDRTYELLAFNDANGNNRADTNEEKGFIKTKPKDSLIINLYPFSKSNINIYKNQNNIYYVTGILPEDRNIIFSGNYWKDTLIADSSDINYVTEKTTQLSKYYITSKNIQIIKRNNKYDLHQKLINKDSQINYDFSKNNTDSFSITLIKDSATQTTIKNSSEKINQIIPGYENRTKIIVTNKSRLSKTDTLNITPLKPMPVHFFNKDSVMLTMVYTDKFRKRHTFNIQPDSTLTLYTIENNISLLIWHDENFDGRITGPDLTIKKPGEAFKTYSDIKISDKIEITLNISVYKP